MEKSECNNKKEDEMAKPSSLQCKKHKEADYKSAAQVGEDRGELHGHSG